MSYLFQIVETEIQPVLSVKTTTSVRNLPEFIPESELLTNVEYLLK